MTQHNHRHNRLVGIFAIALVVSCVDAAHYDYTIKYRTQYPHYAKPRPDEGRNPKAVAPGQPQSIADKLAEMAKLREERDVLNLKYDGLWGKKFYRYDYATGTYSPSPATSGTGISSNQPLFPVTPADPILRRETREGGKLRGGAQPTGPDSDVPSAPRQRNKSKPRRRSKRSSDPKRRKRSARRKKHRRVKPEPIQPALITDDSSSSSSTTPTLPTGGNTDPAGRTDGNKQPARRKAGKVKPAGPKVKPTGPGRKQPKVKPTGPRKQAVRPTKVKPTSPGRKQAAAARPKAHPARFIQPAGKVNPIHPASFIGGNKRNRRQVKPTGRTGRKTNPARPSFWILCEKPCCSKTTVDGSKYCKYHVGRN